jgi:hypothetical protein
MENNNKNLTVWQRLATTFGPDSTLGQGQPDYKLDKKESAISLFKWQLG